MTLSEWVNDNQDTVEAWSRKSKQLLQESESGREPDSDLLQNAVSNFARNVIGGWQGTLLRQNKEKDQKLTANDMNYLAQLINVKPDFQFDNVMGSIYHSVNEFVSSRSFAFPIETDTSYTKGAIDHDPYPSYSFCESLMKRNDARALFDHVLQSPDRGNTTGKILSHLVDNPQVTSKQATNLVPYIASGKFGGRSDILLNSVRGKVGDAATDAELDKLPASTPMLYSNWANADMSRRSAEEIEQHIKGVDTLADAYGGDEAFFNEFGYRPSINNTIVNSPNFSADHMRIWPEDQVLGQEGVEKVVDNPKLSATMGHGELLPLVKRLTGSGLGNTEARKLYSHMVDLSSTEGRPRDVRNEFEAKPNRWFRSLSKNPTFIADTTDLPTMAQEDFYHMFGPDRMSPNLKKCFEDIKPALNDLSIYPHDQKAHDLLEDVALKNGLNIHSFVDWHHLFPILSHYDPQYAKEWMNKATPESFAYLQRSLHGNDNVGNIYPSTMDGVDAERLYSFIQDHGIPLSKLTQESRKRVADHFKSTIPHMDSDSLGHFHDQGDTYNMSMAGEFGALDEYLQHAAKHLKHQTLQVKRGSGTLRALRDFLEQAYRDRGVSSINPRDLPKDKTWNSVYQTLVTKNKDGSTTESKTIDWNPLRNKDGNVSMESVQSYIDRMKPIGVNVTEAKWDGGQRHNQKNSKVVVFGMTNDHIQKLKNAGLWEDFKRVSADLPRGHPQHPFALGWVRYTLPNIGNSHEGHVFIDEVQNDIAKYLNGNSNISDGNKKKIMDILYDGSHPSDLLHEAFHEYARGKNWHDRPFAIHSPESKRPISLSDQTGPVPVHYKKTYEEIVKQRFHVEPAKYGERPDETNKTIQGKPIWTGTIRKMEEQELEKMALADVQGTPKKDHYDYSHLLPDHLKNAYTIRVIYSPATPEYDNKPRIIAQAITNKREFAGSVSGFISGGKIETHQGIKPNHQKQGLGTALLESVLAHAHNAHGVRGVEAAEHTEGATGTHRKVSAKHGLGFESSPTKADKYGQWYEHGGYILKNDDYSDWE